MVTERTSCGGSDCEELVEVTLTSDDRVELVNSLEKVLCIYSFGIPALIKPSIKTSLMMVGATFS